MRVTRSCGLWAALLLSVSGCGSDDRPDTSLKPGDPFAAYDEMNVNAIGDPSASGGSDDSSDPEGSFDSADVGTSKVLVGTPSGDARQAEVCISDSLCEVPEEESDFCEREGGPVDLIYVDGELVDQVCYPPSDDTDRPIVVLDGTEPGDLDIVQMANKTTVVIDPSTNGTPIEGDVHVDGNNVAIYGNGPDETILDGDVVIDGNNARIRGVTITGDLVLGKNKVAVVLCRILGDVRLDKMSTNGSIFAENDIFGSFTSTSNGNLFVGNDVMGAFEHTGNGNVCDGNASFSDDDDDQVIDEDERGEPLDCGDR